MIVSVVIRKKIRVGRGGNQDAASSFVWNRVSTVFHSLRKFFLPECNFQRVRAIFTVSTMDTGIKKFAEVTEALFRLASTTRHLPNSAI